MGGKKKGGGVMWQVVWKSKKANCCLDTEAEPESERVLYFFHFAQTSMTSCSTHARVSNSTLSNDYVV